MERSKLTSWLDSRRKWAAGAAAGLAGLIAVDRGINHESTVKQNDPQEQVDKVTTNEDNDKRRAIDEEFRERNSKEEVEQSMAKVKAGIDELFKAKQIKKDDESTHRNEEPMGKVQFDIIEKALQNFTDITFDNFDYSRSDLYFKDNNGEKYFLATIEWLDDGTFRISPQIEESDDYIINDLSELSNIIPSIRDNYVKTTLESQRKFRQDDN